MEIKVTVTGPNGQHVDQVTDVKKAGDLTEAISQAIDLYRTLYPDAPPFQKTVKVEHA